MKKKFVVSLGLVAAMAITSVPAVTVFAADEVPTIDQINVGEDYQDLTASIKVLTNRTDIVDTVYKGYAEQFMELYPNITVEYEGITDYEESLNLRLTTGDWGDLCFIPTGVDRSELSTYFTPIGDYDTLDPVYNYVQDKTYDGTVYGIANGGTASGVFTTNEFGKRPESQSFLQLQMNSWKTFRQSKITQTQFRFTPTSPLDGQWAHGTLISE